MDKIRRDSDKKQAVKFVEDYLRQDGVFVLRLVGHNTNALTVTEFVCCLWENYQDKTLSLEKKPGGSNDEDVWTQHFKTSPRTTSQTSAEMGSQFVRGIFKNLRSGWLSNWPEYYSTNVLNSLYVIYVEEMFCERFCSPVLLIF